MAEGDPLETELKFLVEPRAAKRLRDHLLLGSEPQIESLRSVYFDTDGRDLAAAGFSLRIRTRAGRHVQTVKSMGVGDGPTRGEWESPVPAPRPDPVTLESTPVLAALGRVDVVLRPIFTTTVRRSTWIWERREDAVEISLDEGQIRAAARRARILELELELKSGDPSVLYDLATRLRSEVSLRLSFDSKAERGYRLLRDEPTNSVGAAPAPIDPDLTAAEAFRRIARTALAQVVANGEILRLDRQPEAIHQMRVGLRRLRAAITAFEPVVEGPGCEEAKTDLAWLAGELDQARDEDVFEKSTIRPAAERARDLNARGPTVGDLDGGAVDAYVALGQRLIDERDAAYDRALAAIHSNHAAGLVIDVLRWVEIGDWSTAEAPGRLEHREEPIRDFAARALDHRMQAVRKRARHLESLDADGRHQLRIRAKKLRYAAEFLAPAFERKSDARRLLSRLEAMQDALGELNDIAVARRKALCDAGSAADLAYAAGRAVGWRERGQGRLVKTAAKAAGKLGQTEPFWRD